MIRQESKAILAQVQNILNEYDYPLSVRQIYYQLVARQIIENIENEYRKLSRLTVIGRDEGILDEEKFADRLRQIQQPNTWIDLNDFMETVKDAYRRDSWTEQPDYIEIWIEKDALRNVVAPVTERYGVPLLIVRGHVSRTAIYQAYQRYAEKNDKDCYLYYFGDFDPSGLTIYQSLVKRLSGFNNGNLDITFERVALTQEQIDKYNLPPAPAKKTDPNTSRFIKQHGDNVVELDALPPDELIALVQESIEQHIDMDIWNESASIEAQETEELQEFIAGRE